MCCGDLPLTSLPYVRSIYVPVKRRQKMALTRFWAPRCFNRLLNPHAKHPVELYKRSRNYSTPMYFVFLYGARDERSCHRPRRACEVLLRSRMQSTSGRISGIHRSMKQREFVNYASTTSKQCPDVIRTFSRSFLSVLRSLIHWRSPACPILSLF